MKTIKIILSSVLAVAVVFSFTALAAETDYQITASESIDGANVSVFDAEIDTPTPAYFHLKGNANSPAANDAIFSITITRPTADATVSLVATDSTGTQYDVALLGFWGPPTGFYVDSATNNTTLFTAKFSTAGAYTIKVDLKKVSDGTVLGTKTVTVNVKDSTQSQPDTSLPGTSEPEPTPKTLRLSPDTVTLKVGETAEVKATLSDGTTETPITALKWSSDKADIASVDEKGVVTAKSAGTATITAKDDASGATATMTVSVEASEIPETGDRNVMILLFIITATLLAGAIAVIRKQATN